VHKDHQEKFIVQNTKRTTAAHSGMHAHEKCQARLEIGPPLDGVLCKHNQRIVEWIERQARFRAHCRIARRESQWCKSPMVEGVVDADVLFDLDFEETPYVHTVAAEIRQAKLQTACNRKRNLVRFFEPNLVGVAHNLCTDPRRFDVAAEEIPRNQADVVFMLVVERNMIGVAISTNSIPRSENPAGFKLVQKHGSIVGRNR